MRTAAGLSFMRFRSKTVLVMALRMLDILLTVIVLRITTEILSPELYAGVFIVLALSQAFVWLLIAPIQNYTFRNVAKAEGGMPHDLGFATSVAWPLASIPLAVIIVFTLFPTYFAQLPGSSSVIAPMVALAALASGASSSVIPLLNFTGRRLYFGLGQLALTFSGIAGSVLAITLFNTTIAAWIIGQSLGQLTCTLAAVSLVGPRFSTFAKLPSAMREHWKTLGSFAIPLALSMPFQWYLTQGFRFTLEGKIGLEELGLFLAGFFMAGKFLNGIEKIIGSGLQPSVFSTKNLERKWISYFSVMTLTCGSLLLLLNLIDDIIFSTLLSQEFFDSRKYFLIGSASELSRIMVNAIGIYFMAINRTRIVMFCYAACAILLFYLLHSAEIFSGISAGYALLTVNVANLVLLGIVSIALKLRATR